MERIHHCRNNNKKRKLHQVNTTNDLKNSSFVFRDQLNVEEMKEKKKIVKKII